MRDKKSPGKPSASVDDLMRSVYEALSVKVLAEQAADAPPSDEDLEALDAQIEQVAASLKKPALQKKRTTR